METGDISTFVPATVDLDRDVALVIHQHVVDLCCGHAVTARRVDPDRNVTGACVQLVAEQLRGDVIVKPAFLRDGAA